MTWVVAGTPRSGTSATMRLALTYGAPVVWQAGRNVPLATYRQIPEARTWEMRHRWTGRPRDRALTEGAVCKALLGDGLDEATSAVVLLRPPGDVHESWARNLGGPPPTPAQIGDWQDRLIAAHPDAPTVWMVDVRERPAWVAALLREAGWPLLATPTLGPWVDHRVDRRGGTTTIRSTVAVGAGVRQ